MSMAAAKVRPDITAANIFNNMEQNKGILILMAAEEYCEMAAHDAGKGEVFHGYSGDLRDWYDDGQELLADLIDHIELEVNA